MDSTTASNVYDTNNTTGVVTPAALNVALSSPPGIGSENPNTGAFTDVTASAIYGAVLSTNSTAIAGTDLNTVITPAALRAVLENNPFVIGDSNPQQPLGRLPRHPRRQPPDRQRHRHSRGGGRGHGQRQGGHAADPEGADRQDRPRQPPPIGNAHANTGAFSTLSADQIFRTTRKRRHEKQRLRNDRDRRPVLRTHRDGNNAADAYVNNLYASGDASITGVLTVVGGINLSQGSNISSETDSFSPTDGALTVAGGTGIGKNLNVGGAIHGYSDATVDGILVLSNTTDAVVGDTPGALSIAGGATIDKRSCTSWKFHSGRHHNTHKHHRRLRQHRRWRAPVSGGAGIAIQLFVGGQTHLQNATGSTDQTTGALVVAGGADRREPTRRRQGKRARRTNATDTNAAALTVSGASAWRTT